MDRVLAMARMVGAAGGEAVTYKPRSWTSLSLHNVRAVPLLNAIIRLFGPSRFSFSFLSNTVTRKFGKCARTNAQIASRHV
jgi:hypothetical protein